MGEAARDGMRELVLKLRCEDLSVEGGREGKNPLDPLTTEIERGGLATEDAGVCARLELARLRARGRPRASVSPTSRIQALNGPGETQSAARSSWKNGWLAKAGPTICEQ
jgi:hypothetical protein